MPNIKSAKKQARQNIVRRARNKARKTEIKSLVKRFEEAIEMKDFSGAQDLLRQAESKLAQSKSKGVIHWRTAARKTSRLAQTLKEAAIA